MSALLVPSQIVADLTVAYRLERDYHEAVAESDWVAAHLVTEEIHRRIGRVEGALNVRVPVQPDTRCARCLTLLGLKREIRTRFQTRVLVDTLRHG
jgi:CRP-like cAMP-binding protein